MNMHITNLHTNYLFYSALITYYQPFTYLITYMLKLPMLNLHIINLPIHLYTHVINPKPSYHLPTYMLFMYLLTYLLSTLEPTYHQPTYQSIFGPYFDTMLSFLLPITHLPTNLFLVSIFIQCCHLCYLNL